jgi:hypothetical protein
MISFDKDGYMELLSEGVRHWALFYLFMLNEFPEVDLMGLEEHIDWIARRDFTPDSWLGKDGSYWRQVWGFRTDVDRGFKQRWVKYRTKTVHQSMEEISRNIEAAIEKWEDDYDR